MDCATTSIHLRTDTRLSIIPEPIELGTFSTCTTMNEFLKAEYEASRDLLKHYDQRHLSLVKFTTGTSSTVVSLVFGFYTLSSDAHAYFWKFAGVLAGITGIGLLVVFASMVQNRLYFIYPIRQMNAIRKAMLTQVVAEFSDNQMYLATDVRPFKLLSMHTLMNFLVALQVSIFLAFSWFCMTVDLSNVAPSIVGCLVGMACISILIFALSAIYLARQGQKHPDKAVHSTKEERK